MATSLTTSTHEGRRHEVLGIITGASAVLVTLSLWSYDARGGDNWIGPVGTFMAGILATAVGVGAWVIPLELLLTTVRFFRRKPAVLGVATLAATLIIVLVACAMAHLAWPNLAVFGGHLPGGVLGEVLGEVLRSLLGLTGAYIVGTSILLITVVLRAPVSLSGMMRRAFLWMAHAIRRAGTGIITLFRAWRDSRALEADYEDEYEEDDLDSSSDTSFESALDEEGEETDSDRTLDTRVFIDDADVEYEEDESSVAEPALDSPSRPRRGKRKEGPKIIAPSASPVRPSSTPAKRGMESPTRGKPFELPPPTLFTEPPPTVIRVNESTLRENARRLVEKLEAYGVKGRVDEIHPGPVVTMYEFEPQSGTKLSKIANLADDLAMALAAQKVRIVAPIPGKARVGFELPNDERQTVYLREILEDDRWVQMRAHLPMALGKDIAGHPVYGDLSKMPHLLVAGATGQGKSVGINVMLASLLTHKTPEEVRLLMIDPKVVELAVFDGIPHMLLPVVTDMKKAALALRWAVDEMERRYQLFADAGCRNIITYNVRVEKVERGELAPDKFNRRRKFGPETGPELEGAHMPAKLEQLPYVVVVVDEFSDLMMVAAKDVEACIARLAQKARAAGIHVILATQRPSVDVITGMIKANFPCRMAFKVSQREDSKTILGRSGAEHLLGKGDMLMLPPGASDLKRVHGAYIDEDEVKALCDFLREQADPIYDEEILRPRDDEDSVVPGSGSDDPLYDKAVAVVAQAGYCSISHIQRQLSVGYNKAAKLVERMEEEGVVGPPSGKAGGRRDVLIQAL